jgi:predicted RNase H-like HicB family nuclease
LASSFYFYLIYKKEKNNMKNQQLTYPATFKFNEDGSCIVNFRDIPEAITQGDNMDNGVEMAQDALVTAFDFYFEDKRLIPPPSEFKNGEVAIKVPVEMTKKVLQHNETAAVPKVTGFEVVPIIVNGDDVTKQSEGPDEHTTGWAVYALKEDGTSTWIRDFLGIDDLPNEEAAIKHAEIMAAGFGVKVVEPAWRTNPYSEYNRRPRALKVKTKPKVGDSVIATHTGPPFKTSFKKGATGKLVKEEFIDGKKYYSVELDNGVSVGPSLEDYWDKHNKE